MGAVDEVLSESEKAVNHDVQLAEQQSGHQTGRAYFKGGFREGSAGGEEISCGECECQFQDSERSGFVYGVEVEDCEDRYDDEDYANEEEKKKEREEKKGKSAEKVVPEDVLRKPKLGRLARTVRVRVRMLKPAKSKSVEKS